MSQQATTPLHRKLRRFLAPSLILAVFVLVVTFFGDVLIPFILALIIVYLIEPLVKRLHRVHLGRVHLPRWVAVVSVYLVFFGVVTVFSTLFVPPLVRELSRLASEAPKFFDTVRTDYIPRINREFQSLLQRALPPELDERHLEEARQEVHSAVGRARSLSSLVGAMTPEERESFLVGGANVVIEEPAPTDGHAPAMRIRNDPETGDWLVMVEDIQLVNHPTLEGTYLVRSSAEPMETPARGPPVDLEKDFNDALDSLVERSGEGVTELISVGQGLALGLLSAFVGMVLTFMIAAFISVDLPGIMAFFRNTIPEAARETYDDLIRKLDVGLSGVVRGQLTICLINGTLTAVGLLLFGVKFALVLALLAGILSLIPIFGTIVSSVPIVAVALATSGIYTALLVLGWILMIHFVEANILNPKIIGTQAHIHPALVIFALLAGEHTYGLIGALLAVPVASIFLTLFRFVLARSMEDAGQSGEGAT